MKELQRFTFTIPIGASESDALVVYDKDAGSFEFPAEMTGSGVTIQGQAYKDGAWGTVNFYHPDTQAKVNLPAITKEASKPRSLPACCFSYYAIRLASPLAEDAERVFPGSIIGK